MYVGRRLKGGARRVYLVRRKRVVAVGLGARSLVKSRKALAAALRGAMKGPVSTLDPPGASAATGPTKAALAQAHGRRGADGRAAALRALHHRREPVLVAPGSPRARPGQ